MYYCTPACQEADSARHAHECGLLSHLDASKTLKGDEQFVGRWACSLLATTAANRAAASAAGAGPHAAAGTTAGTAALQPEHSATCGAAPPPSLSHVLRMVRVTDARKGACARVSWPAAAAHQPRSAPREPALETRMAAPATRPTRPLLPLARAGKKTKEFKQRRAACKALVQAAGDPARSAAHREALLEAHEHADHGGESVDRTLCRAMAACPLNAFGLWSDGELCGSGLYPAAALFNHACMPNIAYKFSGKIVEFYALRAIEPGEPLSISYIVRGYTRFAQRARCAPRRVAPAHALLPPVAAEHRTVHLPLCRLPPGPQQRLYVWVGDLFLLLPPGENARAPQDLRMPTDERRDTMRAQWGFTCGCLRCAQGAAQGGAAATGSPGDEDAFMARDVCVCGAPRVPGDGGDGAGEGACQPECVCSDVGRIPH